MDIDQQRLRLERQRLAIETVLKRRDQRFQREQFELSGHGLRAWAHVVTPMGVAIIAGIVGLFGTVWNGYKSNEIEGKRQEANYRLERQRLEANLILEAIRTAGTGPEREKQAAANLLFLAELGFITLPPGKVQPLRNAAADALPLLPATTAAVDWPERLREAERLKSQAMYLETLRALDLIVNHPDVPSEIAFRAKELQAQVKREIGLAFDKVSPPTR